MQSVFLAHERWPPVPFYAPSLKAKGETVLFDYITGKFYLDFTSSNKTLGLGVCFSVNKP